MDDLVAIALYPVGTASLIQIVLLAFAMLSALWGLFVYPWRHWLTNDRTQLRPGAFRAAGWTILGGGLAGAGMLAGALEDGKIMQVAMAGTLLGFGVGYFIANQAGLGMLKEAMAARANAAPTGTK